MSVTEGPRIHPSLDGVRTSITVPRPYYDLIERLADRQGRSLSQVINAMIAKQLGPIVPVLVEFPEVSVADLDTLAARLDLTSPATS